jgi:AGZA family xanthine/uracil permease-like MFS transporter
MEVILMLGNYFQVGQRRTSVRTEIVAGLTTFLTMAYIIFANPVILSDRTGMNRTALIAVTCLVSAIATFITGFLANAPIAMAPGMGLNAFFAFTLVITRHISYQTVLGVVFLAGLFFLILTRARLCETLGQTIAWAIVRVRLDGWSSERIQVQLALP